MPMSTPAGPLTQLSKAIRDKRLTASKLAATSIERLEGAKELNVLAEKAYDDAVIAAKRIDDGEHSGGALLGIPTLVKDLEDWRGHPTRKGSLALPDAPRATLNGVGPGGLAGGGGGGV